MIGDCNWIEGRLDDLFSDDPKARAAVQHHLAGCSCCRTEVEAHGRIDELLSACFKTRVREAGTPPPRPARPLIAAAAFLAVGLALWVGLASSPADSITSGPGSDLASARTALAKPGESGGSPRLAVSGDRLRAPQEESDFYVVDLAGYAHTWSDFRGRVAVLGVLDSSGRGRQALMTLYEAVPANDRLRFLAVFADEPTDPAVPGLPAMVNRGSRLFGTAPGEFSILTPEGDVIRQGSLGDPALTDIVSSTLAELGIPRTTD